MILKTEQDLIDFGEQIGKALFPGALITLKGDLGAGKTTLTKGIGKGLGVTKIINSPTFTIMKEYQGEMMLHHFDAYRLEGEDSELGFEEIFEGEGVCVVEWPQYIEHILPEERLDLVIYKCMDQGREILCTPFGEKYVTLAKELEL